jgi:hypothetical protein
MPRETVKSLQQSVVMFGIASLLIVADAQAGLRIGVFAAPRGGGYALVGGTAGDYGAQAAAYINAHLPGVQLVGGQTLNDSFLNSVDILLLNASTSLNSNLSLTLEEQAALLGFVKSGKGAVLLADGFFPGGETLSTPFGATVGYFTTGQSAVVQPNHPVANGPYGTISVFTTDPVGFSTSFIDPGPYATVIANGGANALGLPVILAVPENALAPGSGRVVLFSDAGTILVSIQNNDGLLLNSIAYVVPEASSIGLLSLAGATAACVAIRGRRRLAPCNGQ